MRVRVLALGLLASFALACGEAPEPATPAAPPTTEAAAPDAHGFTAPSAITTAANAEFGAALALDEQRRLRRCEARARRERAGDGGEDRGRPGVEPATVRLRRGRRRRPSVNPSLWRQAKLNGHARSLPGGRRHLPGARLRRLEHDLDPRQDGLDRRRSADERGERGAGATRSRGSTSATTRSSR